MKFVEPLKDQAKTLKVGEFLWNKHPTWGLYFFMGIFTGLRASDLIRLKVSHILGTYIEIMEQKTAKRKKRSKRILISGDLREKIDQFLLWKYKGEMPKIDDWLFEAKRTGRHFTRINGFVILKLAAKEFGIPNFSNHSMRKTFGWTIYNQSKDLALTMKLLNHSNSASTLRYLGIGQNELDNAISKLHFNKENKDEG